VLLLLIVRVVSFEWASKSEDPRWRATWRWANTLGSIGAPFVWGVALSSFVAGVPLDSDGDFAGDVLDLFSAFTVFAGLVTVLLFAFHGATFLTLRTAGDLRERSARTARGLAAPAAVGVAAVLAWTVAMAMDRNEKDLLPPLVPAALGALALLLAVAFAFARRSGWAFAMTGLGTVLYVATIFTSLYPRVLVSHPQFANSLTVADASSSHYALTVMTVSAAILSPIVLLYQGWTYHVLRARVGGGNALAPAPEEPRAG
jgi:cytochrome d ubiquinol oxidase subunit II